MVMSYVHGLLRYFVAFFFYSGESNEYCGDDFHVGSIGALLDWEFPMDSADMYVILFF